MRKVDLTKQVMKKVVSFEKKRVRWWLGRFLAVMAGLLAALVVLIWIFQKQLIERDILDLFNLLHEDREIIKEYWQDTLGVIWEELPHRLLILFLVTAIILIIFVVTSKNRLKVTRKRLNQLEKYKNSD